MRRNDIPPSVKKDILNSQPRWLDEGSRFWRATDNPSRGFYFSPVPLPSDRGAIRALVNPSHPYHHIYGFEAIEGFWGFYRPVAKGGSSPEVIIIDANRVLKQVGMPTFVP